MRGGERGSGPAVRFALALGLTLAFVAAEGLVACSDDGVTPDCSRPDARCGPISLDAATDQDSSLVLEDAQSDDSGEDGGSDATGDADADADGG